MDKRDTFQRNTGLLNNRQGTQSLTRPGTRPLVAPEVLRQQTETMLGKGRQSLTNLEPRVELLMRACQEAQLAMPGVTVGDFKHPLSPKGEQIIAYLQAAFRANPALSKSVQVAVFRFQDAEKVAARAQKALEEDSLDGPLLEELKLKLFYLTRFHEELKVDKVLQQLFPAPATAPSAAGAAKPGSAPLSTVDRLKAKQAAQAILHKAEILASKLAPRMELVQLVLEMLAKPQGLNLQAMFTPTTRQARMIAMGLGGNKALVSELREVHALFGQLNEQLKEARKTNEVEPLKQTIYPLSRLALSFRAHPLLKDLFPFGEQDLFPDGEGASGPAAGGAGEGPAVTPTIPS